MRFNPSQCPECGELASGMFETVPGWALIDFDENGEADYFGQTDVQWDNQKPIRDEQDRVTLVCPVGHQWQATMTGHPLQASP